jgi:hypothetical protein
MNAPFARQPALGTPEPDRPTAGMRQIGLIRWINLDHFEPWLPCHFIMAAVMFTILGPIVTTLVGMAGLVAWFLYRRNHHDRSRLSITPLRAEKKPDPHLLTP